MLEKEFDNTSFLLSTKSLTLSAAGIDCPYKLKDENTSENVDKSLESEKEIEMVPQLPSPSSRLGYCIILSMIYCIEITLNCIFNFQNNMLFLFVLEP